MRRLFSAVAGLALVVGAAADAGAATFDWNNTSSGTFSNPANWTPVGGPPGPADTARFALSANSNVTFSGSANVSAYTQNSGNVTFFLNGFALQATAVNFSGMGADNATATLRILNGSFQPAGFTVGGNSGSDATLTLDAATVMTVNSGVFQVGNNGTGTLIVQNGSQLTTNADTRLATNVTGVGTATVNGTGSSWNIPNNTLRIGVNNDATVNVLNGGTMTANALEIGEGLNTNGTLNVSGAGATFTTGGTANIGGVSANAPAESATLAVGPGATVNLNGTTNLRTNATLNLTGGTINLNTLNFVAGASANWTAGTVNFANASSITPGVLNLLLDNTSTLGVNRTLAAAAGTINLTSNLAMTGGTIMAPDVQVNANVNVGAFSSIAAGNSITIESGKTIQIEDFGSISAGPLILNNGGVLQLNGQLATVGSFMANNFGVIQGTGRFAGGLNNGTGGIIRARDDDHLIIQQSGLTNPGRIELFGGTVEYTHSLSNLANGVISGRGTLRVGGTLSNLGQVLLSSGISDVFGNVISGNGSKIIVTGGAAATFFNNVTMNNGSEFRVSTGSTAVFFGDVLGTNNFTGSGTKIFEAGTTSLDSLATLVGDTTIAGPATLTAGQIQEDALTVNGVVTITGPGASTIPSVTVSGTFNQTGGSLSVNSLDVNGGTANLLRVPQNAAVTINGGLLRVRESSPDLSSGHPSGDDAAVSRASSLNISAGGTLDLTNNDLILDYTGASPIAAIEALVASGYNVAGDWKGNGITSSTATENGSYTLAVADNAALTAPFGTAQGGALFSGVDVDLTSVLIKFTHRADINLDGVITPDDAAIFGTFYDESVTSGHTWAAGDMDYDGACTPSDAAIFGTFYDESLASLPEPAGLGGLGLVCWLFTRRRLR